jgi:hypothetical protein
VGFKSTIPASGRAKTVHALDSSATVTDHDLYLVRLILVSKMNYKIVLWNLLQLPSSRLLQNLRCVVKFTEYLADAFLGLKALANTHFAVSIYVSLGTVYLSVFLL